MFKNPEFDIDQMLNGGAYIIGPTPFVAYTVDDARVEVASAAPAQVSVARKSPGLFGSKYCLEVVTTISKPTMADQDNDNIEFWIEPCDMRAALWGTPYAQPVTISLDIQASCAGDYAACMADSQHTVHCLNKITIAAPGVALSRASVTFPAVFDGDWSQGGKFIINLGTGPHWSADPATMGTWQPAWGWSFAGAQNLTMQPVGSFLRIGNIQADIGLVAQPFRYIPDFLRLQSCQRVLVKTMAQAVAVNREVPAGYDSALTFFGDPNAAAGLVSRWQLPVEMLAKPNVYTFSAGLKNDSHWFQANGGIQSGAANIVSCSRNAVAISNPAMGYPNGSSFFLHAVATAQRGGNGWL